MHDIVEHIPDSYFAAPEVPRTTGKTAEPDVKDKINHPPHYTSHPSGVQCADVAEHYGFNLGNVIKYVWRAGLKDDALEDLKKAEWYLKREIARRETK